MYVTKTQATVCPRFSCSNFEQSSFGVFLIFKIWFQDSSKYCNKKYKKYIKKRSYAFVRNKLAKLKVDLSRFRSGAGQVFTNQKQFLNEISTTGKLQHQIFSNIDRITVCQFLLKPKFLFTSKLNI